MAQYRRLGYVPEVARSTALADELILTDLYEEVAAAEGIDVPDDDMAPFNIRLDDATFDPADLEAEVNRA